MNIIQLKDVWEMYKIKFVIDGRTSWDNFWALRNISFDVEKGETLGIIGENGSGKSTLLKLIAGMLKPDRGEIKVSGRVSGLLELGAGLQPELTGRENIYSNASLFGLNQNQIEQKYQDIVDFASLGRFIHAPVKSYSQGMFVRLSFSVAINMDPDILLIDDILVVGDEYFQKKCIKKIFELKEQGKTIIFVTHNIGMLTQLCERAIFLKQGRIIKDDLIENVIPVYAQNLKNLEDGFILSNGKLRLIFDNGRAIISYNGINLTEAKHMFTSIYANKRWYPSNLANWEVKKEKENKLIAKGTLPTLPVTHIWEIELNGEASFIWKANLQVNKEMDIKEQFVELMCRGDYKYWFSDYGAGEFPNEFLEIYMDMLQRCIPNGTIGLQSQNNQLPILSLKFSKDLNNFAKIFNTDFYHKARMLRIQEVVSEENLNFPAGEYRLFEIEVNLSRDSQIDLKNSTNVLQDEILRLNFDKGKGRIYWKGIELTKGIGLYTSIRSEGRWHDSYSRAAWKIYRENRETLKAFGKWLYLPLSQHWEIRLKEDSVFELNIKMRVDKEIKSDRLQTNLMLLEKYCSWASDKEKGLLPSFKKNVDDDWDLIWPGNNHARSITVTAKESHLPSAVLTSYTLDQNWRLVIVNSDIYHRGRILQCLNSENEIILPGEYNYFHGEILFH